MAIEEGEGARDVLGFEGSVLPVGPIVNQSLERQLSLPLEV